MHVAADENLHEPLPKEIAGAATAPSDVSPCVPTTHAHFGTVDDLSQATPVDECITVQKGRHDKLPEDLAAEAATYISDVSPSVPRSVAHF